MPSPRSRSVTRAVVLAALVALAACATAPSAVPSVALPAVVVSGPTPSAAPVTSASAATTGLQDPQDAAQAGLCHTPLLEAARDEVNTLRDLIKKLPDDMSPAPAVTGPLMHLTSSPCFGGMRLVRELDLEKIHTARSATLKAWWQHAEAFFDSTLDRANAVHFAPSVPTLLSAELLPAADPLRTILCPSVGAACDPPTEGTMLDLGREVERVAGPHLSPIDRGPTQEAIEACARAKPADADDTPLETYINCVQELVPKQTRLPLGHFRSPRGWLVLQGRRGHYSFCDETRAYDLATGAAYIASRCSSLVLVRGGSVDHDATSRQSTVQTTTGTLSVEPLRRLALMLWLKDSLDTHVQPYAEFPLPAGVPMPADTPGGSGHGGSWGSSAQTRISFAIVDGGQVLRAGKFTWPNAADTGDQIVDDLVVSVEATLQPGCPPASLPADFTKAQSFGGVSGLDASAASLRASAEALTKAMVGLKSGKTCRKK